MPRTKPYPTAVLIFLANVFLAAHSFAQTDSAALPALTALETNFVHEITSYGFTPALPMPPVYIDNPPSFGNYDNDSNVLHIAGWATLPDDQKGFFAMLAGQLGNNETGQDVFEKAAHKWIFVHELGHWWRACTHQDTLPYDEEVAANRIALAYWRAHDAAEIDFMMTIFKNVVNNTPSPVPAGADKRDYFNTNYDKLPGGAAYSWYQSAMVIDAYNEQPALSFKQAIANSGYATFVH